MGRVDIFLKTLYRQTHQAMWSLGDLSKVTGAGTDWSLNSGTFLDAELSPQCWSKMCPPSQAEWRLLVHSASPRVWKQHTCHCNLFWLLPCTACDPISISIRTSESLSGTFHCIPQYSCPRRFVCFFILFYFFLPSRISFWAPHTSSNEFLA